MGGTLRVSTCELRGYWALVQGPPLSYVEWCGHEQRFLVVPHIDRERAALGPIFGEAA